VKKLYIRHLIFIVAVLIGASLVAQPANDPCTGAQTITPNGSCVSGTTVGATDNFGGTVGCQSGSPNNHPEVWYRFVSTGTSYLGTVTGSTTIA
jgi:hypothetical protein